MAGGEVAVLSVAHQPRSDIPTDSLEAVVCVAWDVVAAACDLGIIM